MCQPLIKFHPHPAIITQVLCIFVVESTPWERGGTAGQGCDFASELMVILNLFRICPPRRTRKGSRWDAELNSAWHLEPFVIYTLILGKPIQYLYQKTTTHRSPLTTQNSNILRSSVAHRRHLRAIIEWCVGWQLTPKNRQNPPQWGGFCLFYRHFNAQTPPRNTPFLALLQRNAKAEYANYNNINALHFCILQFTFLK